MIHRKPLGVCLLIVVALSLCISPQVTIAQTDDAILKLHAANSAVEQAFKAVLAAEKAGANVTDLMFWLNYGSGMLAQAENFYRTGHSNEAADQADKVLLISQQIIVSAQAAMQNGLISGQNAFWFTMAFTLIFLVGFILALFIFWHWFKRGYMNRLLKAKPEVNSQ